jgi:quercetin dioxygenase-like cupin family protein
MTTKFLVFFAATIFSVTALPALAVDTTGLPEAFDAGWEGRKTCELMYETDEVRVGRCTFPPGVGHEKHFHYPHFGYVIEGGLLQITDSNGDVTEARTITGGRWSTDVITVHSALNIGDTTTSYLIVEPKSEESVANE